MIVGIDLGTTNSLVGVWRDGAAQLIPSALGDVLTPSAVSLMDDDTVLVGAAARERLATHPMRSVAGFMRYMGTGRSFTLGRREFRPEELSALVLRALKSDAEAFLNERISEAVITIPAYFNDAQRKATRAAGEIAGLKVDRLLTEPTAAALAYGIDETDADEMILVIDLGGGTFDVSLLHMFEGVTEVRAAAGDSWLGGEDFAETIIQEFCRAAGEDVAKSIRADPAAQALLRRQAELAKRRLSDETATRLSIPFKDRTVEQELTRERFEQLSEPLLARLRYPIERALRDGKVDPDQVARVILAGGATRMPMVKKLVSRLFRRFPSQTINPDWIVAQGAAVRAGMLMRDAALEERVMTDVAPFTLGIGVSRTIEGGRRIDNAFAPIIERNTVIPASRVQRFFTIEDNQAVITVQIFQGEAPFVDDNIKLGEMRVKVPAAPAGEQAVDVRFTYDPSGLLEVETTAVSTKAKSHLVIEGNPGILSRDQIAARLEAFQSLKIHPRDQAENQLLLARAKRLFEERLGFDREQIHSALLNFQAALDSQDADRISPGRRHLESVLTRLEGDLFE